MAKERLDILKDTDKSKVFLIRSEEHNKLMVEKHLAGELEVYHRLMDMPHPFLPKLYDVRFEDGKTIVTEEYIPGETLAKSKAGEKQIIQWITELCEVLSFLHSHSILHRDIKPSNLLIGADGHIRLIDFDASREEKEDAQSDTRLLGTKGYAPPEQYGFSQTDPRADIYSVGVTIKALLGKNKSFRHIIRKCTEFSPDKRYQTAKALAFAIKTRRLRKSLITAFGAAAAAVIAICGSWLYRETSTTHSPYPVENGQAFSVGETDPLLAYTGKWYASNHDEQSGFSVLPYDESGYSYMKGIELDILDVDGIPFANLRYWDEALGNVSCDFNNDKLLAVVRLDEAVWRIDYQCKAEFGDLASLSETMLLSINAQGDLFFERYDAESLEIITSHMPLQRESEWMNGQYLYYDEEASGKFDLGELSLHSPLECEALLQKLFYGMWYPASEPYFTMANRFEIDPASMYVVKLYGGAYRDMGYELYYYKPEDVSTLHKAFFNYGGTLKMNGVEYRPALDSP